MGHLLHQVLKHVLLKRVPYVRNGCIHPKWETEVFWNLLAYVGAFRAGPVLCFYFKSIWNTPKYAQRGEWGPFGESVKNLNVMKNWISSFWSLEVHALCIKLYLFKLDLMWFTVQWPNRLLISSIELSHGVIFPLDWTFKDFIIYSPSCCPACKKEATILIYKNICFYYSSVCIKSIFWVWSKNSFKSSFHFIKASFIYIKSDCWGRHW